MGYGVSQTRMLGFWCFNAGIGFFEIQSLKPRSIILTSSSSDGCFEASHAIGASSLLTPRYLEQKQIFFKRDLINLELDGLLQGKKPSVKQSNQVKWLGMRIFMAVFAYAPENGLLSPPL